MWKAAPNPDWDALLDTRSVPWTDPMWKTVQAAGSNHVTFHLPQWVYKKKLNPRFSKKFPSGSIHTYFCWLWIALVDSVANLCSNYIIREFNQAITVSVLNIRMQNLKLKIELMSSYNENKIPEHQPNTVAISNFRGPFSICINLWNVTSELPFQFQSSHLAWSC